MKKIASILFLLMATVVCFAQEEANDSINKPSKFASWTISDAFQAEAIGNRPLTLLLTKRGTIVW